MTLEFNNRRFKNASLLLGNQFIEHCSFGIESGIFRHLETSANRGDLEFEDAYDLKGAYVVPGLIDLQLYGVEGFFFGGDPSVDNLRGMENDLLSKGVTGFLATVATNTDDVVIKAIEASKAFRTSCKGAFLGLHLEGPFLNPIKKGAHPAELIRKATLEEVKHWIKLADGEIKMMTVAPELQDEEVLKFLKENGVVVSAGHSNATYAQANAFMNKTVTANTHLFNAMTSLHHREPGIVASIFENQTFSSIIPDGIHVDFGMIKLAKRILGERLFIITDRVASSNHGTYQHQFKGDRYETPAGVLSGSSLDMLEAVKNCIQFADIPAGESFAMASKYPAQVMNIDRYIGEIGNGYSADFLVLNQEFEIQQVWFQGQLIDI